MWAPECLVCASDTCTLPRLLVSFIPSINVNRLSWEIFRPAKPDPEKPDGSHADGFALPGSSRSALSFLPTNTRVCLF